MLVGALPLRPFVLPHTLSLAPICTCTCLYPNPSPHPRHDATLTRLLQYPNPHHHTTLTLVMTVPNLPLGPLFAFESALLILRGNTCRSNAMISVVTW